MLGADFSKIQPFNLPKKYIHTTTSMLDADIEHTL